ncbi:uncharacterized protein K452DRAFT_306203 [Aplosporella prunicola CBS 121167]|uniref:Uncharacterized protein n=1 Tax=Aplosporella prunicola CBS 121167 TaxID=1176127 RepID=A0A6A6BRU7_9PEZI|nr:uncharacterized protein K452DRAFT_306203 [Aplosporella prunicola CBS 121167]KAF2145301.1 hypothetical protein K452DRAFT_306203 [Aplosporella prunicola CBS 121167]
MFQPVGELKMWGIPLSQLPEPPPPERPSQEILSLHVKAVKHPESLTDGDRRRILDRLPAGEEDQVCRNICGLSWEELVQKAISQPDDLTDDEARLVAHGVNYPPIRKDVFPHDDYSYLTWKRYQTEDEHERR